MKPKTMILMALAITCGLGASYMTSRLLAGRQVSSEETVNILVAKNAINVGDLLKKPEEVFVLKTVNVKDAPEGAVKDVEALKEKIMKKSLRKGDHITLAELYGTHEQLEIPDGHVAVGIKVSLETSAHGAASLPRSRVNVNLTVRVGSNDPKLSYVQVLLEDVLVLAADGKVDRDGANTSQVSVVTLALKPEEAQKMIGAEGMGKLTLSLRKPGDNSRAEKTIMTFEEIKNAKQEPPASPSQDTPPVLVAKLPPGAAPKAESKLSGVVRPKIISTHVDFYNGKQLTRHTIHQNEDGDEIEVAPPARPNAQPQGQPSRTVSRRD